MEIKTIDDFIEQDLHGAVDKWMEEYKEWMPKGREDTMKYALRRLIAEGVTLYQEFEEEDKKCIL